MEDLETRVARLHRPQILIDAAHAGQARYDRDRDLPPLIGRVPSTGAALLQLLELESIRNTARKSGRAYRVRSHVAVLIALIAEYHALRAARPGQVASVN